MKHPRVSLFHMFYNQLNGARAAVEASFAQDYPNLEIVFSDDASTDGTYEALKELVDAYDGPHDVILTRNARNRGIVGNFNTCIEKTSGDLIVQANGDDIAFPNRVSKLVEVWQSDPSTRMVYSAGRKMTMNGVVEETVFDDGVFERWLKAAPANFLIDSYWVAGAVAAYDRRIFDAFGPVPEQAVFEDRIMPFRAKLLGQISRFSEPLIYFRAGGVSDCGSSLEERKQYEHRLLRVRVGDAKAFMSEKDRYSFPGKARVTLFYRLVILRGWLSENIPGGVAEKLIARTFRRRIRRWIAGP